VAIDEWHGRVPSVAIPRGAPQPAEALRDVDRVPFSIRDRFGTRPRPGLCLEIQLVGWLDLILLRAYRVPVEFVRALVEQESAWRRCAISSKWAAGLMQLMPGTARRLGVQDRCDLRQNISGGVRHLAYLMARFHGDLRLVAAAYYAGESVIEAKGLRYSNPDVVAYMICCARE